MKNNVVIKNTETERYLMSIYLGKNTVVKPLVWTDYVTNAIKFENADIANATIEFIGNVINWELEQELEIIELDETT